MYLCAMKRKAVILLSVAILLFLSCTKGTDIPSPRPERDLSTPEKVEREIMEVLSKDWKSLADTFAYFNSNLLIKRKFRGWGPDGVFYGLRISSNSITSMTIEFQVEDSIWVYANGSIIPPDINLHAFDTNISIEKVKQDSTSLSFSTIKVVGPDMFFCEDKHQSILFFEGSKVGYIILDELENTDYSTGKYLIVHYYNDPRTFAFYDRGFSDLLKLSLTNVLK